MPVSSPTVSVILPAYNAETTIARAIDSVLSQSFSALELVVIDDGSTDNTAAILSNYYDPRVRVISKQNKGIVAALNDGLQVISGDYVARMDADDYCHPDRLSRQYSFMREHDAVVACGCNVRIMDEQGEIIGRSRLPSDITHLKSLLLTYSNIFVHPAVMINVRKAGGELYYKKQFEFSEDLDLWFRLLKKGGLHNISDCLLYYQSTSLGITSTKRDLQLRLASDIRKKHLPVAYHHLVDFFADFKANKSLSWRQIFSSMCTLRRLGAKRAEMIYLSTRVMKKKLL